LACIAFVHRHREGGVGVGVGPDADGEHHAVVARVSMMAETMAVLSVRAATGGIAFRM
jgi:hypothetical protein